MFRMTAIANLRQYVYKRLVIVNLKLVLRIAHAMEITVIVILKLVRQTVIVMAIVLVNQYPVVPTVHVMEVLIALVIQKPATEIIHTSAVHILIQNVTRKLVRARVKQPVGVMMYMLASVTRIMVDVVVMIIAVVIASALVTLIRTRGVKRTLQNVEIPIVALIIFLPVDVREIAK